MAVERIDPEEARREVTAGRALLVCAYEDESKCNRMRIEGAMTLHELQHRTGSLPKDRALIFYCGWPAEATSAGQAEQFQARGFPEAKALRGGVDAWQRAGLPMAQAA